MPLMSWLLVILMLRQAKKIFKQRVALEGAGKSGGARTIVAFHEGDNVFFMYGFEKNQRTNISKTEKEALQKAAKVYFALTR